ncbi:MAG: hypothetical protein HKN42_06955 [Granulosicoccus sp.]|nr:hypothetical protein [Granulosicoccus sp.]
MEAAVLMVVMVPAGFGLVMIGKLIDLKQTSEQAGRYAAWEATVQPAAGPVAGGKSVIRARFFSEPSAALSSTPVNPGSNRLWGAAVAAEDRSWSARTAVTIDEATAVALAQEQGVGGSSVAMRVGQSAGAAGKVLDGLRGNSWGLSTNGLIRAGVGVQVQANEWLASADTRCSATGSSGCLSSASVILVDGWSASSDDQARRRVRSLMPASALEPLGDVVANVGHIPMMKELRHLKDAFGHVDMQVLPEYARP